MATSKHVRARAASRLRLRVVLGATVILVAAQSFALAGPVQLKLDTHLATPAEAGAPAVPGALSPSAPVALAVGDLRRRVGGALSDLERARAENAERAQALLRAERYVADLTRLSDVQERTLRGLETLLAAGPGRTDVARALAAAATRATRVAADAAAESMTPREAPVEVEQAPSASASVAAATGDADRSSLERVAGTMSAPGIASFAASAPTIGTFAAGLGALAVVAGAGVLAARRRAGSARGALSEPAVARAHSPTAPEVTPAVAPPVREALAVVAGPEPREPAPEAAPGPIPEAASGSIPEAAPGSIPEPAGHSSALDPERAPVRAQTPELAVDAGAGVRAPRASQNDALREVDTLIAFEDYEGAARLLEPLVEADPDNAEFRLRLAHVEAERGNLERSDQEAEVLAAMMDGPLSETLSRVRRAGRGLMPGNPLFDTHIADVAETLPGTEPEEPDLDGSDEIPEFERTVVLPRALS